MGEDAGVTFEIISEATASGKRRKTAVQASWSGGTCSGRLGDVGATAKYLVGVYHKDSKRLDVYDTKPIVQLRHAVDDGGVAAALLASVATDSTYAERKRALVETFGSKRKQRAQAARDANTVGADTIAGARAITRQLQADGQRALEELGSVDAETSGVFSASSMYPRVPKFSPYGKRACACAQRPGFPQACGCG